jgi:hypothetical protein
MTRSILTLSALVASVTIAVAVAPTGATSMNQSVRPQPASTPNSCEGGGYPLFALANISNAEQRSGRRYQRLRLDSSVAVTFYNLSTCGYQLDQYTDSNSNTHCELVSANNTVLVQFWFDPEFYSSNGISNSPLSCSTPGPLTQPARTFESWSRVRTPSFR